MMYLYNVISQCVSTHVQMRLTFTILFYNVFQHTYNLSQHTLQCICTMCSENGICRKRKVTNNHSCFITKPRQRNRHKWRSWCRHDTNVPPLDIGQMPVKFKPKVTTIVCRGYCRDFGLGFYSHWAFQWTLLSSLRITKRATRGSQRKNRSARGDLYVGSRGARLGIHWNAQCE